MDKMMKSDLLQNQLDVTSIRLVKDAPIMSATPITEPMDAVKLIGKELCQMDRECVVVLCLKANGVPICCSICSVGCLNQSMVHPREIFKTAILANAANIILLHNHPSSSLQPSKEDVAITDRMVQVCKMMDIPLLDHIIVGGDNNQYFSFKEKDILTYTTLKLNTNYHDIEFDVPEVAETNAVRLTRRHR